MTEGIRIDALSPTVLPSREHEFPAMREGLTVKLSVGQILALLTAGDIKFDPETGGALDAETVQAAIDELAGVYVSTRAQVFDAAARSRARLNIGADYAPGTVNIATLSSGVLEIPTEGEHFVLTWPGNADFTITGFGDLRPAGKVFSLLVPRTIADTGGAAYAYGNKVSFVHSTSGAGLDLAMNKRMFAGSPVYTYEAFPNANDSEGDAAALYEKLTFVPLGGGRHRLVALPDPCFGDNANGTWCRCANGLQIIGASVTIKPSPNNPSSGDAPFPVCMNTDSTSEWNIGLSLSGNASTVVRPTMYTSGSSDRFKISLNAIRSNDSDTLMRASITGPWK